MTEPNKLEQAHREVDRAQQRLRDLDEDKADADAGGLSAEASYSQRKFDLEVELEKAQQQVRRQETVDTDEAGDAGPRTLATGGGEFVDQDAQAARDKLAKDKELRNAELEAAPKDHGGLQGVASPKHPTLDQLNEQRLNTQQAFAELLASRPEGTPEVAAGDAGPSAPFMEQGAGDKIAQDEEMRAAELAAAPRDPSDPPGILQPSVPVGGEFVGAAGTAEATLASYEPLPPPGRKLRITPESPSIPDGGYVKPRVEITEAEREAHRENIEKWRDATTIDGAAERQAHKPHGRQAHPAHGRQEHAPHGMALPKKPVLVAAIGMLVALVGVTAVVARPTASDGVPAQAIATGTPVPATATRAATTPAPAFFAPVGAMLTVVPRYSFLVTESCPVVPGSQRETLGDGTALHVVRLAPKVVTNPAPGTSASYDWGMFGYPGPRCPWTLGLDYERTDDTRAGSLLFSPSTTYSYVQAQPTRAAGGGQQVATILTVTNRSR
jgi:hypothetical protein